MDSPPTALLPPREGRLVFIDALRGIAAVLVLVHHVLLFGVPGSIVVPALPKVVFSVLVVYGARGVQIFFVISGFVIAHSLRATPMTWAGCGRFMVRRQLRLDPPYWSALLLRLGVVAISRVLGVFSSQSSIAMTTIAANFLYLHRLFNLPEMIVVGWTLTVEIQFYIAFILILAISRNPRANRIAIALLLATGLAAIATDPSVTFNARWAVHAWPYFVAGVCCYWAVMQRYSAWPMVLMLGGMTASLAVFGVQSATITGILVTLVIYAVGRAGRLETLWRSPVLQFFGRISYSLYLTHIFTVFACFEATKRFGHTPTRVRLCLLAALGTATVVAYFFYLIVERPSMRLAARFKSRREAAASGGTAGELAIASA